MFEGLVNYSCFWAEGENLTDNLVCISRLLYCDFVIGSIFCLDFQSMGN